MTTFSPCRRCARRDDCGRLADLRKAMRGTGITKANVKCDIPKADFPVGTPVMVRCFTIVDGIGWHPDYPEEGKVAVDRPGVVRAHKGGKFVALLDVGSEVGRPDDQSISIVGVYHDQLSRAEGRDPVALCACGLTADRCGDVSKHPRLLNGNEWNCWGKGLEEADHGG